MQEEMLKHKPKLREALRKMKRGKAKDDAGIIAEMLKDASETLLKAVLELMNDVLSLEHGVPEDHMSEAFIYDAVRTPRDWHRQSSSP